jgi:hypothetical protein
MPKAEIKALLLGSSHASPSLSPSSFSS